MKYYALTLIFCLLAFSAFAQQQRIPDLSMSPEETMHLPNVSAPPSNGNYPTNYGQPANDPVQERMRDNSFGDNSGVTQPGTFMTGYCDPNFKPFVANTPGLSGLQSCLESQKQGVCEDFQALPVDAARVLDDTIGCISAASENDNTNGQIANDSGCTANDSSRLQLLKKYWRDEHIAHALVFLPDEVLNASSKCMRGSK